MMQKLFEARLKSAINFIHSMLEKGESKKRALSVSANYYQIGQETLEYEAFGFIETVNNAKAIAKVYDDAIHVTHATDDATDLDRYFAIVDAFANR